MCYVLCTGSGNYRRSGLYAVLHSPVTSQPRHSACRRIAGGRGISRDRQRKGFHNQNMSTEQDPPAEFRPLLQDTLAAPRLSASKVTHLSRLALHNVAHDHSIVTTLYKLNAALPPASQSRISSLYVFDAIARAAKSAVNKGVGKELTNERGKGTQASLLLKLEGVVASWVDGMIDDGKGGVWVEGRVGRFSAITLDIRARS